MKTFKNNLPYEAEVETLDNETVKLRSQKLRPSDSNVLSEVINDFKMLTGDKIKKQMTIIFGDNDYDRFDYNLLNQVLLDYVEYLNGISKKK
jgi:hypothetical protein